MTIVILTKEDWVTANALIAKVLRPRPIVLVDMIHSVEYPFCWDCSCPCHSENGQADLGDALTEGRLADRDAGAAFYGEKPIRPRVA